MASELAQNVFTAPQAPDYLGHYAELVRSIPNAGLQFLAAQQAAAQNAKLQAEYNLMSQKAKAFMDLYPAFKNAQIAKLQGEAATYPARQKLLEAQADYQRAHANMFNPPPPGEKTRLDEIAGSIPPLPGGGAPAAAVSPFPTPGAPAAAPAPGVIEGVPEGPLPAPSVDPFAVAPLD
jgi:hypothetical protein